MFGQWARPHINNMHVDNISEFGSFPHAHVLCKYIQHRAIFLRTLSALHKFFAA